MSKDKSGGYVHDASDRALDKSVQDDKEAAGPAQGHDEAEIRKHDDVGKDRLFEGREQHDDADMESDKNRLAKDMNRHKHKDGDNAADGTV